MSSINPFAELIINSTDTDVLLLLVYYQTKSCNRTLFRTGRGKDVRSIDVKDAYESTGSKRAKALLGHRAFGGSDFTCTFNGKSKLTTWRYHSSSDAVLNAFSQLGSPDLSIRDERTAKLQTYVINLYCEKRPITIKTIGELPWYMFKKRQLESEKLPPTECAIRKKVMRSHYVANIWIQAEKSHMDYLNPIEYGWARADDGFLTPELTDLPPAPNGIVKMSLCHCKIPGNTNKCVCKKVELKCTEICPVDTGRKLNVHKTFRRRPGRLLNVLCTFNLRPVSTGCFCQNCENRDFEDYSDNDVEDEISDEEGL